MADEETQGPHDPLAPQNPLSPRNPQISVIPNAPQVPPALEVPHLPAPHVQLLLNWSHFKPEYSRKLDEEMQKLIYLGQMIGWTHMDFRTMLRYKNSV